MGAQSLQLNWLGSGLTAACLESEVERAELVLGRIHSLGVSHGDIRLGNILRTTDGRILFCDFGRCYLNATELQMSADLEALYDLEN